MLQKFFNNVYAYGQEENLPGTDLSSTAPSDVNNIIEFEPAIIPEDSSTSGPETDGQDVQQQEISNTFSTNEINPSESSTSSNTGEQLSTNDHSNTTTMTETFPNPFSFDIENYIDDLIVIIIVVLSSISIYFIIHYVLKRSADSLKIKERRIKGIDSLIKTMLIVISAIIILFQFSTISATVAGFISIAVGSVIGFSSRNTISNAIAGVILLSSRPFKLGDRIQAGNMEVVGDVIEIALIYTKIKTIRNEMITIPNQVLLQNQITNYSGYKFLAISIQVSAGYNEDQEHVKYLLLEAAKNTSGIVKEPKPYVLFKELGDFAAIYDLIAYTDRANLSIQIKSDLRANVYDKFKEARIDLTTPRIVDSYKIHDTTNEDDHSTF